MRRQHAGIRGGRSSNTHVFAHAGRILSFVEVALPIELDRHLETVGAVDGLERRAIESSLDLALLRREGPVITALGRAVLQCYYRDDRVLRSLGLELRAPFPKGYTLEQGDWSLLDAVRGRPRMWRDDRRTGE